jgi:LPXTG-motif cell wall-anchored protein
MLNKRIKSVLIAGLVVLGMGFAKVDSYALEPLVSTIEYPAFNELGEKQQSFQKGAIVVDIEDHGSYQYYTKVTYDDTKFKIKDVIVIDEKNTEYNNTAIFTFSKEEYLYRDEESGKMIADLPVYQMDAKLFKVQVIYEPVDLDGNGIPDFKDSTGTDPEDKKEVVTDPETGDASMITIAGIAIASAVGLVLTRKKDDEE